MKTMKTNNLFASSRLLTIILLAWMGITPIAAQLTQGLRAIELVRSLAAPVIISGLRAQNQVEQTIQNIQSQQLQHLQELSYRSQQELTDNIARSAKIQKMLPEDKWYKSVINVSTLAPEPISLNPFINKKWMEEFMKEQGVDSCAVTMSDLMNNKIFYWGAKLSSDSCLVFWANHDNWQPAVCRAAVYLESFKKGCLPEDTIYEYNGWTTSGLTGESIYDSNYRGISRPVTIKEGFLKNSNVVISRCIDEYIQSYDALDSCLNMQGLTHNEPIADYRTLYTTTLSTLAIHRWLKGVATYNMPGSPRESLLKLRLLMVLNAHEGSAKTLKSGASCCGVTFNKFTKDKGYCSTFSGYYPSIGARYTIQIDCYKSGRPITNTIPCLVAKHIIESSTSK